MKPPRLSQNATVAVIAPASAPLKPAALEAGLSYLRAQGFKVLPGRSLFAPHGYLCGPDAVRIEELNRVLRMPEVDAVFCVRGGYGCLRLLPDIDYEAARAAPKLIVGYSDITALHMALYHRAGLTGLSGPMVSVEWPCPDEASEALFWALTRGAAPQPLVGPRGDLLRPVRPGSVEGTLLGGNLTLLARMVGTPYLPDLDGAVLFLEEVGEEPYRVDGLFAQLKLAGVLDRLGGLVLGAFTAATPARLGPTLALSEVFDDYFGAAPYPVARGLAYGHMAVKNAMPIGVRARLDVDERHASLSVLESVVR